MDWRTVESTEINSYEVRRTWNFVGASFCRGGEIESEKYNKSLVCTTELQLAYLHLEELSTSPYGTFHKRKLVLPIYKHSKLKLINKHFLHKQKLWFAMIVRECGPSGCETGQT